MFRRKKHIVPELNTTSTADISFMLLILFLVTTSMDADKGLSRQLPPLEPPQEQLKETDVSSRNILKVHLTGNKQLTVNGKILKFSQLRSEVTAFIENPTNSQKLPEKHLKDIKLLGKCEVTDRHLIQITAERGSSYDDYFTAQNEIVAAYNHLRDGLARKKFGCPYTQCSETQKEALREYYPQRISEVYISEEGGKQ